MDVNPDKLNAFMGKMVGDIGAAANAVADARSATRSVSTRRWPPRAR